MCDHCFCHMFATGRGLSIAGFLSPFVEVTEEHPLPTPSYFQMCMWETQFNESGRVTEGNLGFPSLRRPTYRKIKGMMLGHCHPKPISQSTGACPLDGGGCKG
mmetsp:Transcript_1919/g.2275  ORF Transcript_1919/g.2275 Transcript_1919/m.2275 type:complete len:103 (-) Transcript_1919:118-426(-)